MVTRYDIKFSYKSQFEISYIAAEFDSKGFEEIMLHIKDSIVKPSCENGHGFSIGTLG